MTPKPRLLPETAEIALTEIKRTFESRLADTFQLRRVSAPLYLPVNSGLCGAAKGVQLTLQGCSGPEQVELVTSLDKWCRAKLADYDIAPHFGLFTVENALWPYAAASALSSPHLDGWAWEMAIKPVERTLATLTDTAAALYRCVLAAQQTITEKFPHLHPMLPDELTITGAEEVPSVSDLVREKGAVLLIGPTAEDLNLLGAPQPDVDQLSLSARFVGWNNLIDREVCFARIGVRADAATLRSQLPSDFQFLSFHHKVLAGELPDSIGGFVSRKHLAMLLLHQIEIN